MENSSLIIGIVITLLILIPTFYFASAGKRKLKKKMESFIDSLKAQSIFITEHSQIGQYIIGCDKNSQMLVYKKGDNEPEIIDLKKVTSCTNNIPKVKKNNIKDNLYIELTTTNSQKIMLEIYEAIFALDPSKEIKVIEDWTNKINELLTKRN